MAFKLIRGIGGTTDAATVNILTTGVVSVGDLLMKDLSNSGVAIRATLQQCSTSTVVGVAAQTHAVAEGWSEIRVIPALQGQLWEADCTNNTSTMQFLFGQLLTDHATLNNTAVGIQNASGVFYSWGYSGATTDKKLLGEIIRVRGEVRN